MLHIQSKLLREAYGVPLCEAPNFKHGAEDAEKLNKINGLLDHVLGAT